MCHFSANIIRLRHPSLVYVIAIHAVVKVYKTQCHGVDLHLDAYEWIVPQSGESDLSQDNTTVTLYEALDAFLRRVAAVAGDEFTGLGVIVSATPTSLPLFPIGPPIDLGQPNRSDSLLGSISVASSEHHDGFHILSPSLKVSSVSQYFSPPIVPNVSINRAIPFGGRYLAALFGSALDGVLATGIATSKLGVVIFADGLEVSRRKL